MGFITGLQALQEQQAKQPTRESFEDRPKATWVALKGGESLKITPMQEIDAGSPAYSEKNGLVLWSLQHSNPDNWKKNAECTVDEGDCYGCAQGWRQKTVMYLNVLVDDGKNDPYVAILSRGLGKGSIAQELIDVASDEEEFDNSITTTTFKLSRTGTTKDDTSYSLQALKKTPEYDLESYDLYDLGKYVFHVSPERQEAYYLDLKDGEKAAPKKEATVEQSASGVDKDW